MKKLLVLFAAVAFCGNAFAQVAVEDTLDVEYTPANSTLYLEYNNMPECVACKTAENAASAAAVAATAGKNHWYLGFDGGAQIFTGMSDKYLSFGQALAPVGGLIIGGDLNHWLSLDANLTVAQFKGLYTRPGGEKHFAQDDVFDLNNQKYWQKGAYIQLYLRANFDMLTIFGGYKESRKSAFGPYVGAGAATGIGKNYNDASNFGIAPTLDYGLQYSYKFAPRIKGIVDLHGAAVGLQLENEGCTVHKMHSFFGAKLGLIFLLGK